MRAEVGFSNVEADDERPWVERTRELDPVPARRSTAFLASGELLWR